ncbi:hypothetical protein BGX28_003432 [Mortierella sp. GBA30]|nr:hypothetical protein BGX28_003432 [Mortierella sp. GBA30]
MLLDKRLIPLVFLFVQYTFGHVPITSVPAATFYLRNVHENQLPITNQTHEIVKLPNSRIVLVSQLSDSVLVRAFVDKRGVIKRSDAFQIGSPTSALHGLHLSQRYPGKVWMTLQDDNKLLLIDPWFKKSPVVLKVITVPAPGFGPHYVAEYGNELWVTLQDSSDVLRINYNNPSDYTIYKGIPRPVFVAKFPDKDLFYTGEDYSDSIMKIDPKTGQTTQFKTGQTPVGMISGPKGIWFTLLGNATQGTGTVGHIGADDKIAYHKLQSPLGKDAALLHLEFDLNANRNHILWLLSSSIDNNNALDMIIKVKFDAQWQTILSEDTIVMPTQGCKAHRILITPTNIFATQLSTSKLLSYYDVHTPNQYTASMSDF